jgi:cell division protein FtsN
MKKYMLLCAGLSLAMAFTSCKSSESAYRKAYDKAKAQEAQQVAEPTPVVEQTPVVTPVQTQTVAANETRVVDNADNVSVRQERVQVVNGTGLKNFSVVVGSFGVHANAEGLQQRLKAAGYDAQVVKNEERNMYRVVAATFDNKIDAVGSRDKLRSQYPDAWLLFNLQ